MRVFAWAVTKLQDELLASYPSMHHPLAPWVSIRNWEPLDFRLFRDLSHVHLLLVLFPWVIENGMYMYEVRTKYIRGEEVLTSATDLSHGHTRAIKRFQR